MDAILTIKQVISSRDIKIQFGQRQKTAEYKAMRATNTAAGYRIQFMRASYTRVLDVMADLAREFDLKYPHDKYTVEDTVETMVYCTARIRAEAALLDKKDRGQ